MTLVNINFKLNQDKLDKEGKTLADYSYQPSVKEAFQVGEVSKDSKPLDIQVLDKSGKVVTPVLSTKDSAKVEITKDTQVSFTYTANPETDKYLKFGEHSIVIVWNISYSNNFNGFNVTGEPNNITHITINNQPPYDNLIGYWNFDADGINKTAYDFSNSHNDGLYKFRANLSGNCVYDDCATFYGGNNSFPGGSISAFNNRQPLVNNSNFTVSVWINPTATSPGSYDGGIVSSNNNAVGVIWGISQGTTSLNNMYYCKVSNATFGISSLKGARVPLNQWTHITCTFNSTALVRYVNGVINDTTQVTMGGIRPYTSSNAFTDLRFGTGWGDSVVGFNGSLDDIMLFNVSINSSQVLNIFNNQSARFYSSGIQ
jgi:hypothetical protein